MLKIVAHQASKNYNSFLPNPSGPNMVPLDVWDLRFDVLKMRFSEESVLK